MKRRACFLALILILILVIPHSVADETEKSFAEIEKDTNWETYASYGKPNGYDENIVKANDDSEIPSSNPASESFDEMNHLISATVVNEEFINGDVLSPTGARDGITEIKIFLSDITK